MKSFTQLRTMPLTTADLMARNYPMVIDDKVYLLCKVQETVDGYQVDLKSEDPVVWLNSNFREQYGQPTDPVVKDLQNNQFKDYTLLSAGVFLFDKDDAAILLRRDPDAPSFAGALTEAAGRCGELPSRTMLKELNEELLVAVGMDGVPAVLCLTGENYTEADIAAMVALKQHQKSREGVIAKIYTAVPKPYEIPALARNTVTVALDGALVDTVKGVSFFDTKLNTLEVRQAYKIPPELTIASIIDGEDYHREVVVKTITELQNDYLTPCLANLVKMTRAYSADNALVVQGR